MQNALLIPNPVRFDITCALTYEVSGPSDFLFNIEVAQTRQQKALSSRCSVSNAQNLESFKARDLPNRFIRFSTASGLVKVNYAARVLLEHYWANASCLYEHAIASLPQETLAYLLPSRYCESDKLFHFANNLFGSLPRGYGRVQAISDWVHENIRFMPGTSTATTSAIDTLNIKAGICRDFAHLTIALLRALNIPARFVAGYDYGAAPELGPTDFHAYVEAFVGHRWFIFDSTKLCPRNGLVRIGTGFDAADVAFATIFGPTRFVEMKLDIQPFDETGRLITLADDTSLAISTSANEETNDRLVNTGSSKAFMASNGNFAVVPPAAAQQQNFESPRLHYGISAAGL